MDCLWGVKTYCYTVLTLETPFIDVKHAFKKTVTIWLTAIFVYFFRPIGDYQWDQKTVVNLFLKCKTLSGFWYYTVFLWIKQNCIGVFTNLLGYIMCFLFIYFNRNIFVVKTGKNLSDLWLNWSFLKNVL